MTNGEKFNEVFQDAVVWYTLGNVTGVGDMSVLEWRDQEYKEGEEMTNTEAKIEKKLDKMAKLACEVGELQDDLDRQEAERAMDELADENYMLLNSFINVGFTEAQAFEMVKIAFARMIDE